MIGVANVNMLETSPIILMGCKTRLAMTAALVVPTRGMGMQKVCTASSQET